MARETRGSARGSTSIPAPPTPESESSKRKRRVSAEVNASSPAAEDVNGDHETKRQRLSLKVNGVKEEPIDEAGETVDYSAGRVLSKEVREAIAVVIAQMAAGLPKPINIVLTLWLPPKFEQTDDNTLGFILKQDGLTWEKLVNTLHQFSEHLLLPCSYPNPVPSLARIHLPVPPLPSHFAPLTVYSFCAALTRLLLQVEPPANDTAGPPNSAPIERWALMQKTPGNGLGSAGGEWFTAPANLREVEAARKKLGVKKEETLIETLAKEGNKFGHASALQLQAAAPLGYPDKSEVKTLDESIIRRASLKAQRWKKELAARRQSNFLTTVHSVVVPKVAEVSWTPSFAPTYDSTSASGLGYQSTLDIMHEEARQNRWSEVTAKITEIDEEAGWQGTIDKAADGEHGVGEKEAAALDTENPVTTLSANAERIEELQVWQALRVRRGDPDWVSERERLVAKELIDSLARLVDTADLKPADLLPENAEPGSMALAHTLARRLLSNRAPIIRGTLDPRRKQAVHDNVTIRLRAQAVAAIGTPGLNGSSPHAAPPKVSPGTPYGSSIREPPPHTLPSANPRYYPQQQPPRTPYQTAQSPMMQSAGPSVSPVQQQQQRQAQQMQQVQQQVQQTQHQVQHPMQHQMQQQRQQQMSMQMRQPAPGGMVMHPSAYGSPMGQFRPPSTALTQMHGNYGTPMAQVGMGSPSPSPGSPAPMNQMAYAQRMVGLPPSQLRQSYAPMPMGMGSPAGHMQPGAVYGGSPVQYGQQLPGTPGTPGAPGYAVQGLPMQGMPGQGMAGMMPGQMQMHR